MSCGTCGVQAGNTMQGDTGVPAGAPQAVQPRCPYCRHRQEASGCPNPRCPGKRGQPGSGTVSVGGQRYPSLAWVRRLLREGVPRVNHPVRAAYIVGSRARKDKEAHPNSDMDIAVVIPAVRGKTALQFTEAYHLAHDLRWPFPVEFEGCTVDLQFFFEGDPELDGYDKIPLE